MKLLIATSFRPFGISKNNDSYQLMFLNSLKNLNCDLTICATQFDDLGVENVLSKSGLQYIYNNIPKHDLPDGKKYSNHKIFLELCRSFVKMKIIMIFYFIHVLIFWCLQTSYMNY
jgi:hypothetical protein